MIRLMVVDNEKDSLLLYKLMFRKEIKNKDIELHCYNSGKKALGALKNELAGRIDLVLSDINMPNMDDFELLKEIKKFNQRQEVYIISASGEDTHIDKAKSLGATDYISKPINFPYLKELILQNKAAA